MYNVTGADDEAMLQHAQDLIASINAIIPPSATEEEEEDNGELEINSDDDDAMEL
jgi:hypothetical protein